MTDEIDRMVYAWVADVIEAQTFGVKALGRGRREVLGRVVHDLRQAALGSPETAFAGHAYLSHSLKRLQVTR